MRRLVGWIVMLSVVFSAATTGMIAVGKTQPPLLQSRPQGAGLCEGHPCWWGMVAGLTPFDEARELTQEVRITHARPGRLPFSLRPFIGLGMINWDEHSRMVTSIRLNMTNTYLPNAFPTLAELITMYGKPCRVQMFGGTNALQIAVIFPRTGALYDHQRSRFNLNARPEVLMLENVHGDLCASPDSEFNPSQAWRGGANYWRYQRERPYPPRVSLP